jgi:Carboxypeptidase regulatory-like domain
MRYSRLKFVRLLLFLVIAINALPALAKPPVLHGQVSKVSGSPLVNAQIELVRTDGAIAEKVTTDKTGVFACYKTGPGKYQLRVVYGGKSCRIRQTTGSVDSISVIIVDNQLTKTPSLIVDIP